MCIRDRVLDVRLLKIPGTVEELAPLAREYGFDGLDVPEAILGDEKKADSAQAAMKCAPENSVSSASCPRSFSASVHFDARKTDTSQETAAASYPAGAPSAWKVPSITFRHRSRLQLIIKRQCIVGNTLTKMKQFIFVLK